VEEGTNRHLRRLNWYFASSPIYFITVCVARRKRCLADPEAHRILISEFQISGRKYEWRVGEYVVMPDHVHFICWAAETRASLSVFVGKWKEWTSKALSRDIEGFAWQPEFFDHVFRSEKSLAEKRGYMRQNPIRAGLVEREEDWPYRGIVSEM